MVYRFKSSIPHCKSLRLAPATPVAFMLLVSARFVAVSIEAALHPLIAAYALISFEDTLRKCLKCPVYRSF
jgi:hypothetical protein